MTALYDPTKDYEWNYAHGPASAWAAKLPAPSTRAKLDFLGQPVRSKFGIPAGPLLNANFIAAAFANDFDLCVYKTVRSRARQVNAFPNVLAVHTAGQLVAGSMPTLVADTKFSDPDQISISNSFGVPSRDPDVWQPDMQDAVAAAGSGQLLIGGFQGSRSDGDSDQDYIGDHVRTAHLVLETGAKVLELNLSCPNEGTNNLLCFDTDRVVSIVDAIKSEIGDTPLLIKLAAFTESTKLAELFNRTVNIVDGYSTINTIPAKLVDAGGDQALPGAGRVTSGVCGKAVFTAGHTMVSKLHELREHSGSNTAIIGVGGIMNAKDALAYQDAGADAAMSATGAMWNPDLARSVISAGAFVS